MKPDLHCHSHFSDGKHTPAFLIEKAIANGISHLAITDHDCITWKTGGDWEVQDLQLIPGVEISAQWQEKEVHIVGLFIDPADSALNRMLEDQRLARRKRITAMDQCLQKFGIEGLVSYLEQLPCLAWTRSHVAEFLVKGGHCKNWDQAFKRFLSRRGKAYVPIQWTALEDVVRLIRAAGGVAVLAHPGRYALSKTKLSGLVSEFVAAGGEALEGSYGNIDPKTKKLIAEKADAENLYVSVGSDFHDAERHWTDIGKAPALDRTSTKNAIWNHPRWHF
ncbi:MAG: PHP domain-containing protein [Pseudomonadales bacterium]|nr:PHP domain-containing protein [Pseudomonadales bacterium]